MRELVFALVVAGVLLDSSLLAQSVAKQSLRGHVPSVLSGVTPTGRLPAANRLQLSIGLPLRNTNELSSLLADISDPASPQYRHYLTVAEFTERFGPTESDYDSVIAFARTNGFRLSGAYSNRMLVDVEASVAEVEKALHVTLRTYRHPTEARECFAPDVEPSLELAAAVLHIGGLDNLVIPRPLHHVRKLAAKAAPQSGSASGGTYAGVDFRTAYVPGVTLTGAGQTVGLVQFNSGFYPSDITNYESAYVTNYATTVLGLTNYYVPLTYALLNGISSITNGAGPGVAEPSLDVEMSISMAPGLAAVRTYEGTSTDTILNQIASENVAKQISASWTYGIDSTSLQDWQEMAAQGQSFFNASGDSDAYTGAPSQPTDVLYLTSVGGTTLSTSGAAGSWSSETVWNWGGGTGGSGGISTRYTIPVWQQSVSMATNLGSTTMRNLPDVAMCADNVHVVDGGGGSEDVGGTSCASPLWAGFTALVNQQAVASNYPTVGFINPAVYALGQGTNYGSTFHDITSGNNFTTTSSPDFSAAAGYDLCTGWGTPHGQALISALAIPGALRPTAVAWGPAATVSGDTNVFTLGIPVYAYDWNNVLQAVNGVTFLGASSTSAGGTNVLLSGFSNNSANTFTATASPYNALSTAYKNILAGADWMSTSSTFGTVTLENLVSGHVYAAQVWVNDARSTGSGRSETLGGNSGSSSTTLAYNSTSASGGVGQYALGFFTALGTNQTFTLMGAAATQLNALQVRDVTSCDWNYWAGYTNGNWDNATLNWGSGQSFAIMSARYNSANFADTNFWGGPVTNNVVTIQASGASLGAVSFVNNTVNYTLQNASGVTGLTGSTAVTLSGAGTVTFAGANTYTGATTVNNGSLVLSGGTLANSKQVVLNGGVFNVSGLSSFTAGSSQPITFGGGAMLAGNLTLNGAVFTNTVTSPAAPLLVVTNLTYGSVASGFTITALPGYAAYPVQFPLLQYVNGASGAFNLTTLSLPTGYAGYLSNNLANSSIDLVVVSGGGLVVPLTWAGNVNDNWDILTTTNWVNSTNSASPATFENQTPVIFNDSAAAGATNIAIQATLLPASVAVSNAALNYTFAGGGQLNGSMNLTKSGPGALTINTTNAFTGGTAISGGLLQLNAATAAGSGMIANNATLAVNIGGNTLSNAVTGAGAINLLSTSGATTTLGGSLSAFTGAINCPASAGGAAKTAIVSAGVNLNSGAVVNIAAGGTLYLSGVTVPALINVAGLGNSENLGALRMDNSVVSAATVTLQTNAAFGVYTGSSTVSGVVGDGGHGYSLLLDGAGRLTFTGVNTYGGGTILNGGTVVLGNAGALGGGAVTVTNSSTLSGVGITLTNPVSIVSGQTLTLASMLTVSGAVTGSGNLTSSGTNTLSGAKTYGGATTISGGTLILSGGSNILPTNTTVHFSGSGTLNLGAGSQSVSGVTVADQVTGKLTAGGTVTVTGGSFRVGNTNTGGTATLNLASLSSFIYSNVGGIFDVGGQYSGSGGVSAYGNLYLATNSAITAAQFGIADIGSSDGATEYSTGTVWMAQSTTINANTLKLGITGSRAGPAGVLQFQSGVSNPTLNIHGTNGVSRVPNPIYVGEINDSSYPESAIGKIDLTTGVSGASTLNALVGQLILGMANYANNYPVTGAFLMGGGTLDATNIILGQSTASSDTGSATAVFSLSGGTVRVTTLTLGDDPGSTGPTVSGTFTLNSGTVQAQTIQPGANSATRTFNWNGGMITNYAGANLTIASGLTLTLGGSGSPAFAVGTNLTATVNAVLAGTNSLGLAGPGTLVLNATNSYTGTTTLSNGVLQLNGVLGTNSVTVRSTATLAGTGNLNGAVTVQSGGTLAPGGSGLGVLTCGSSLNLNSGSLTLMGLSKTGSALTNDVVAVTGSLTQGGTLMVTNLGTGTLASGDSFHLFSAGAFSGAFSSKVLPALAANLVWDATKLATNGALVVAALPVITNQPQSLIVMAGSAASFTVGATGSGTLAYQWQQNGTNLIGATTNVFNLAAAQPANAGNYSVIVTNNYGSVTSQLATLTVYVAPTVFAEPQSLTVFVNSNAAFSVTPAGIPAPACQWYFNGTNISGATATNYIVVAAQTTNEGAYTVILTSAAGAITSSVAGLSLYREYGCAPAPYPSLLASDGARHLVVPGFQLGVTNLALLATTDARTNVAGQDGVVFTSALQPGQGATMQVVASAPGYLNAWVDWFTNGSWADAGDQVFTNLALTAGANALNFAVPATAAAGTNGWARLRFSSQTNLTFTGQAPDGEVEDYPVIVSGLTLTYLAGANGTISGVATQTVSYAGSGCPVTASPAAGYYFVNWSDGLTVNPRTDSIVISNLTVTANFAVMTVAPVIAVNPSFVGDGLQFSFSGTSGQAYRILVSTDLLLPMTNWTVVSSGTFGTDPVIFTDPAATNQAGFYRVVSP